MTETSKAKRDLRSRMRAARLALRPGEAQTRSCAASAHIVNTPEFAAAKIVASYKAMPGEVDVDDIFFSARKANKTVLLPRVVPGAKDLVFCEVSSFDELRPGVWNILEPAPKAKVVSVSEADLIVIPGVAFDMKGGRLGQGGGYYDRVLKIMKAGASAMAIAFDLQMVDEVPREPHDAKVHSLATESGITRFV